MQQTTESRPTIQGRRVRAVTTFVGVTKKARARQHICFFPTFLVRNTFLVMKLSAAEQMLRAFKDFRAVVWRDPMRESIKFLHQHNMSLAGIVSLMTVGQRGELSVSDLAEETGLSVAAESQLVNKLVRDGFVRRTEHPGDRRRKQVTLTARGTAFLRRMDGAHTGAALAVLRRLPDSTLRRMAEGLEEGLEQLRGKDSG